MSAVVTFQDSFIFGDFSDGTPTATVSDELRIFTRSKFGLRRVSTYKSFLFLLHFSFVFIFADFIEGIPTTTDLGNPV